MGNIFGTPCTDGNISLNSRRCKSYSSGQLNIKMFRYPQNLARNTAKHGCPTEYTMVPDCDMIPIPDMASMLSTFIEKQK